MIKKLAKHTIAILLCIAVIMSMCTVAFAQDDTLRVMIATDTHLDNANDFRPLSEDPDYDEENPFFHKTSQGQMDAESEAIIRALLEEFKKSDEEILLMPGDITDGYKNNHEAMAKLLKEVEDETGKSIFVVPGNHDIDDDNTRKYTTAKEFSDNYYEFGYSQAVSRDESSASYTCELNDEYRLLAIDSCDYGEDEGEIDGEKLNWIKDQLKKAQLDGKKMIAMMHHSLLTHFYIQFILDNYMELAELFADSGVRYVFTGHFHGNDIAMAESKSGNRVYDIMTGSLITAPCSFRRVAFSEEKVEIKTDYVTEISTEFLPKGYTQLQLDMIKDDFPSYARGFFDEGIRYWLQKMLGRGDNIAEMLSIEEGTEAFEIIDGIMHTVGDALELPIYNSSDTPGESDAIEDIAKLYGYALPESEYEYPYEIVSNVMAQFFAGDENITEDSVEIRLLFSIVPCGLTYAVGTSIEKYGLTDGMRSIMGKLGISVFDPVKLLSRKLWYVVQRSVDSFLGSALIPIIIGVSDDMYAPDDLNVTLEGTEKVDVSNTVPLTMFEKVLSYFKIFFKMLVKYLLPWKN